jgi:paraquat-inducible protein B
MSDDLHRPEIADIPEAVAQPKRRFSLQLVWIIPIVAALIGITLAVRAYVERGQTITITFITGEGLEAGKTNIRYKEVEIGKVEKIVISEDRSHVIVTARVNRESKGFLVEDTRFWVVRPRISGGYVSGLNTLLGGTYIGMDVGKSKEQAATFKGLEVPPVVTTDVPGSTFYLHAADLGSLSITSPVFFRRLNVGQVVAYDLDKDGRGVTFTIFINSPYDQYVRSNTRFWNASGIDFALNASGLKVKTESLVSILLGGIDFEAPEGKSDAARAAPNSAFTLFADREDAMLHAETARTFLLIFRESVRGLSADSPVEFHGVRLGGVNKISLEFDPRRKEPFIAVEIELYPERMHWPGMAESTPLGGSRKYINDLVSRGLRARLASGNPITGQRYVALDFIPKAPKAKVEWGKRPPLFPSTSSGQVDIQESLARIARKIDKMPLEELAAELRQAVRSLDQTLNSADTLIKRVDAEIVPEARAVLDEAHKTLGDARGVLATDAPLQNDLRDALRELSRAAGSVRILMDYLERNPESLIRGKRGDGR